MKKIAALALSLTLLFSASSCIASPNSPLSQSESLTEQGTDLYESTPNDQTKPDNDQPTDAFPYDVIETNRYYKIEEAGLATRRYTIYNSSGNEVFSSTTDKPLSISMLGQYIVHIAIGMGTGTSTHLYYKVYDSFSNAEEYTQVIASTSEYVAYLDGTLDDRKVVVKSLFYDFFYKEFELTLAPTEMPVRSAHFSGNAFFIEYDVPGDAYTSDCLYLYDTSHDHFATYSSLIALLPDIITTSLYYTDYVDFHYPEIFGVTNEQEAEWLGNLIFAVMRFSDIYGSDLYQFFGYDIKDLNGDGVDELIFLREDYTVLAIYTMVDGRPYQLDHFWERKKGSIGENGIISVSGSGGADIHSYETYRIADDGKSLELIAKFGLDGHEWVGNVAVQKYFKTVNGKEVSITEDEFNALYEEYPFLGRDGTREHAGLTFTQWSHATEDLQEAANQAYLDVLANKIKIYDTQNEEFCYLIESKDPYSRTPLYECTNLGYALVDLDGDLSNELVVECPGGTLLLRYYDGSVYMYDFTFRNMYYLYTDGTYSWNHTGSDFEYGQKQLYFVGAELRAESLWCIVNDGEPNAEYYIGDRQVTEAEQTAYIKSLTKTKFTFSPLDFESSKLSIEEAQKVAENYWSRYEIEKNGYIVVNIQSDRAPSHLYVFVIKWFVIGHYSTFDEIWINPYTGEAIIPYSPDGKG